MIYESILGAIGLYIVAAALLLKAVVQRQVNASPWALRCLALAFGVHSLILVIVQFQQGPDVLRRGSDYFLWLAWLLPLVYFIAYKKLNYPTVGALLASATALFLGSSSLCLSSGVPTKAPGVLLLPALLHIFPAILSQAALVLAGVTAFIYLIQYRRLKLKTVDHFSLSGPSLESLELYNYRFVLSGFVLMTLATLTGTVWALSQGQSLITPDFLQWLGIAAWCLLAFMVHLRVYLKQSARRLAFLTLCLAVLYAVAIFVVLLSGNNILHGGYHV